MIGFRFLLHRLKSDGLQTRQSVTYRVRKKAKKAGPIANFWPNLARCRALISTLQYLKGSNICFKKTVNHKSDIWNRISDPPTKKRKTMINTATEGENHKKREQIQRIKDSLKQFKKKKTQNILNSAPKPYGNLATHVAWHIIFVFIWF